MAKFSLSTIVSGFNLSKINSNFATLLAEMQNKVLYRDNPAGEPNSMNSDLDMDSNRILNLPAPLSENEPVRLQDLVEVGGGGEPETDIEAVQDIVGAMVTGNTEDGINVLYQDPDGTLDFVNTDKGSDAVDALSIFSGVASDSGTAFADNNSDTLTVVGAGGVVTSVSGDTLTIDASGVGGGGGYTDEEAQDTVAEALTTNATHDGVSVAYVDGSDAINITNDDKGSTAVATHESTYDHAAYDTVAAATSGTNTGDQDVFVSVASDSGTAIADNTTDTLSIVGGTDISTSVAGDTLTIDYTGGGGGAIAEKHFSSASEMLTDTSISVGDVVLTAGYYNEGDGGGNLYKIVAAATGTDDGGSFIDLIGISGQAKGLFPGGVVLLKQFGAKGDNSTNDQTDFGNWIDYLQSSGLKGLVTDGTYLIKSTTYNLTADIDIECHQQARLKEHGTPTADGLLIFRDNGVHEKNLWWKGGIIDRSNGTFVGAEASSSGIVMHDLNIGHFRDVFFYGNDDYKNDTADSGISCIGVQDLLVQGCRFQGWSDLGIYPGGDTTGLNGTDDNNRGGAINVVNNTFYRCAGALHAKRGSRAMHAVGNYIDRCRVGISSRGNTSNNETSPDGANISGNTFSFVESSAIDTGDQGKTIISGNLFYHCAAAGSDAYGTYPPHIIEVHGGDGVVINGNMFYQDRTLSTQNVNGVDIKAQTGAETSTVTYPRDVIITNNLFDGISTQVIERDAGVGPNYIYGNHVQTVSENYSLQATSGTYFASGMILPEIAGLVSDPTSVTSETSTHRRAILAAASGTASGTNSLVTASQSSTASGSNSFVAAADTCQATDQRSAVVGASNSDATGNASFVGGSSSSDATGDASGVIGSSVSTATSPNSFVGGCSNGDAIGPQTAVLASTNSTTNGPNAAVIGSSSSTSHGSQSGVIGTNSCTASGTNSFTAGSNSSDATGSYSAVIAGDDSLASNTNAFVGGGEQCTASGPYSAVVGGANSCTASGSASFVGGSNTCTATGDRSAVLGSSGSDATDDQATVVGSNGSEARALRQSIVASVNVLGTNGTDNTTDRNQLLLGSGASPSTSSRTIQLRGQTGDIYIDGAVTPSAGLDYAEMFPNGELSEIPVGTIVTHSNQEVVTAGTGDEIAGVVSATATVLGGAGGLKWQGKYLYDEFGRVLWEEVDDPDLPGETMSVRKENPNFDESQSEQYIPRQDRPNEWTQVGLLGQVYVRVDQTVEANKPVSPGAGGVGTLSVDKTGMRCMEITTEYTPEKGYAVARCMLNVKV